MPNMVKSERQLLWSRGAEDDLLSIWRYGAQEWSPDLADEHVRVITRTCAHLIDYPHVGRSRDELVVALRSIIVDPHTVFYKASPKEIEIVRILHQREDIETIFH